MSEASDNKLIAVELDTSIGPGTSPEAEHERRVAIYDIIEENSFTLIAVPTYGNFFPQHVSFLLSMRYYAGNWAYTVWLLRKD